MSAGSKVTAFQMCAQKNESEMNAGAQRTLKLISVGALIRRNTVFFVLLCNATTLCCFKADAIDLILFDIIHLKSFVHIPHGTCL